MFVSTYLPVNMRRMNCAVYSNEKVFPEDKLLAAYSFITGKSVEGVLMEKGCVSFIDSPETSWTLPEIYLAYEAYKTAAMNNFSYYMVKDKTGIPQLFVSKAFKNHRILVNAFTMRSILLTKLASVNKAASLIDKTVSSTYCVDLYNTLKAIEKGSGKYLSALIVDKGGNDEFLAVSPLTTVMSEVTTMYGIELIDEFRKVCEDHTYESDYVVVENDRVRYKMCPRSWPLMTFDFLESIVDTYDKVDKKKSNYVALYKAEDYEPALYFSTNHRYLVNANTFECIVIKNQHTKSLLINFAMRQLVSSDQLQLAWMLAKTE